MDEAPAQLPDAPADAADTAPVTAAPIFARLAKAPWSAGFFATLRQIDAAHPHLPPLGTGRRPAEEAIRIGQATHLGFAASQIDRFVPQASIAGRLDLNFFGVLGAQGPMPLAFSEYVRRRERPSPEEQRPRDPTAKAFLDVFHHRLATSLYRAWMIGRPPVELDRAMGRSTAFAEKVAASFGGGDRLAALPDGALRFAGRLAATNRSAPGLAALLGGTLSTRVRIDEFTGRWLVVLPAERSRLVTPPHKRRARLGAAVGGGAAPTRLGRGALLGRRVFDPRQRFRLRLGPMDWRHYQRLLPTADPATARLRPASTAQRLFALVAEYVEPGMGYDARLILRRDDVPRAKLGARSLRLGHSAWLPTAAAPRRRNRGDLVLRPTDSAAA